MILGWRKICRVIFNTTMMILSGEKRAREVFDENTRYLFVLVLGHDYRRFTVDMGEQETRLRGSVGFFRLIE